MTYQKIYFDFFSYSQWEKHLAYAYNVDYWPDGVSIAPTSAMLKLRYANYPKDYFMGVLPNSQYDSVAVLPAINSSHESTSVAFGTDYRLGGYATLTNPNGNNSAVSSPANTAGSAKYAFLNSDLSALSIRATEYLQRWKEVVQIGRAHV